MIDIVPSETNVKHFWARCQARAYLYSIGVYTLIECVDELQRWAKRIGLIEQIGQDEVLRMMSDAIMPYRPELWP